MTDQELFDKVARHLLNQQVKSETEDSLCRYRGPNGTMCAIGVLIPDEHYDETLEGGVLNRKVAEAAGLSRDQLSLGSELQLVHDICEVDEWYEELLRVAKRYELDTSVLDEFTCD